jgi:hypothetical protein
MTRRLLLRWLALSGIAAAFNMETAGEVIAESKSPSPDAQDACRLNYAQCIANCSKYAPKQKRRCTGMCDMNYISCDQGEDQGIAQKQLGVGTPPKGTDVRTPVDVGVKEPGAGVPPKGTHGRTDVGVFKDPVVGTGTPPKGPRALDRVDLGKKFDSQPLNAGTIYKTTPSNPKMNFNFPAGAHRGRH